MPQLRSSQRTRPLPFASTSLSIHSFWPAATACTILAVWALGLQRQVLLGCRGDIVAGLGHPERRGAPLLPLKQRSAVHLHVAAHPQHGAARQLHRLWQQHHHVGEAA